MTAPAPGPRPARTKRRDQRPVRQAAHRADRARAVAGQGPAARVAAPFDHLRRVIRGLPPDKADELADRTVRFMEAAAADYTTPRRSRRNR